MKFTSIINYALCLVFFFYVFNTIWTLAKIFIPPNCEPGERCLTSHLIRHPKQDLCIFSSFKLKPYNNDIVKILEIKNFDYKTASSRSVALDIPRKTRNNGTMFLFVSLVDSRSRPWLWAELSGQTSMERIPLVVYSPPQAAAFNLLEKKNSEVKPKEASDVPVAHLKSQVTFSVLIDPINIPANSVPGELLNYIRLSERDEYLPLIQYDFLKSRVKDLIEINSKSTAVNVTIDYSPASIGKMKLLVHISLALQTLYTMGFNEKNVDEVKGIFADTNIYLLCATILISSFHLLFDFLAFKNDVSFWKGKKSMAGLSGRTVLWRAFSQTIVTLYLLDEKASLLIMLPYSIGTAIEMWKVKKMLRFDFSWKDRRLGLVSRSHQLNKAELQTRAVDAEAMRYLSYVLYPICVCGAVYSLLYEPHKSWYSWTLNSMVNGVYAFGFLFMLPQLFINYKLKSVAALPWRAFMYKAFNTFIDDVFAFIITMPVAHRVACFRDDIVFLIYLYQRWLYPVDETRLDDTTSMEETCDDVHQKRD